MIGSYGTILIIEWLIWYEPNLCVGREAAIRYSEECTLLKFFRAIQRHQDRVLLAIGASYPRSVGW